jgi:hypothetical protein
MSGAASLRPRDLGLRPLRVNLGRWWVAVLLETAHLGRAAFPAWLLLLAAAGALLALADAPTAGERAVLVTWGLRSGMTAVVMGALLIPCSLDPASRARAETLRELGIAGSWSLVSSLYLALLFVSVIAFAVPALGLILYGYVDPFVISVAMAFSMSLQLLLYISPAIAIVLFVRFLPFGVAERALLLAILGLVSHRIVTPLALPMDLLALHPAGESWLQSTRSLGESLRHSVAGTLGGLFLATALVTARTER